MSQSRGIGGFHRTVLALILIIAAHIATAATNIVTTTADDNSPGCLRQVISNSVSGDIIIFAPGLSGGTILLTSGQILLDKSLVLDASPLPDGLTINGNTNGRIFQITNGSTTVSLDSLTITNGKVDSSGGGGIYSAGTLILNKCTVAGNTASHGGGIVNAGTMTLNLCTVAKNASYSYEGGGIYNWGTLTLNKCTIAGNVAAAVGGGIYNESELTVNQSTLANNSSGSGGGIFTEGAGAVIIINNSTLSGNYATYEGGGIFHMPSATSLTLFNSIIAGNTRPGSDSNIGRLNVYYYYLPTFLGVSITNGNPMLAPLGNYGGPTQTMPPFNYSPAIDACTNDPSFTTDQRGFPRPVDGNGDNIALADIGAVEGFIYSDGPGMLMGLKKLSNGMFQFGFPNYSGRSYTVFASTNLASPFDTWSNLGTALETPSGSGQYQFTDPQATNNPQRFYRVRSP